MILHYVFYGNLMINTDTLNLLRLNSVSPHQPGDRNTHKHTHSHTYHFNKTWLSAGLLSGNGYHGDSRCSIRGSRCCAFPAPCFLPMWYSTRSIQHSHQIMHQHLIMHAMQYITASLEDIALHKAITQPSSKTSLSVSFMSNSGLHTAAITPLLPCLLALKVSRQTPACSWGQRVLTFLGHATLWALIYM